MTNKTKSHNTSPTPSFLPGLTSLLISLRLSPQQCRGTGNGITISSSHVSAAPSSPHSSPARVWCPSHRRQSSMNFSNMSPSHRIQFFRNCSSVVLPTGCSPSGMDCSSVGPPRGHKPCQ